MWKSSTAVGFGLLLFYGELSAQSATTEQARATVNNYRTRLEVMERREGRYEPELLEVLERLVDAYIELNQFDEADAILDRSIQIVRINEGLFTDSQFPFLVLSIRNNVRRENWRAANETLEHLVWLYTKVPRQWNEALVAELQQLSDLHLEGVAGDAVTMTGAHFRAADRINRVAIQVAETIWPQSDPRLIGLYYQQVIQNHIKYVALNQGGTEASHLRQVAPGSGLLRPRRTVQDSYYRLGMQMLSRMRHVFEAAESPDLEALAMVDLYRADWQVVFNEEEPEAIYAAVYENFKRAGVEEQLLGEFFSVPRVLPVADFYPGMSESMQAFSAAAAVQGGSASWDIAARFVEWSGTTPNIQVPVENPLLLRQQFEIMNTVWINLNLNGVEAVARWVGGRRVRHISVTDGFDQLESAGEMNLSERALADRLHYVKFRPVLDGGVPQVFQGLLEYRYFSVDSSR